MKFKLFGLTWDLMPVKLFLFIIWCGWCMFGGMAGGPGSPEWFMPLWIGSVVVTLALLPNFESWFKS